METEIGPLLLPAYDTVMLPWIRHYRSWEPEVARFLRTYATPGDTVLDLGAHVGYHSIVAARAVGPSGKVIAIEPEPTNFELLLANLERNGVANVQAVNAAAWSASGHVVLRVSAVNSGDHRVVARPGDDPPVSVRSVAVDDLLPKSSTIDVVKSDLQGCDHVAIRGLEATISRHPPVMAVEFWPAGISEFGDDPLAVVDYYRRLGFELSILEAPDVPADAPPAAIVEAANAAAGSFCTIVLLPTASRVST